MWSTVKINKIPVLIDQGRMQPAGLAAFELRDENRSGIFSHVQRDVDLPEPSQGLLRANTAAWDYFQKQPASYRKASSWWVMSARQEKTRLSRMEELITHSARAERILQFTWKKSEG